MTEDERLEQLVSAVRSGARYAHIHPGLIRRIAAQEMSKGRSFKDTVKETRNKLHQVGGAYQEKPPDYARWTTMLNQLPDDLEALRPFCKQAMQAHASTRERLPYLEDFYGALRDHVGQVESILDLACGLNPLAAAWIPLVPGGEYLACDIYGDMVAFLNHFFARLGMKGTVELCDLVAKVPDHPVQLVLLLKTLPCLEQLERSSGLRLLDSLRADTILVSFPSHSLGGRRKGMSQNYTARFEEMVEGRPWKVERWSIPSELAFLIRKN